MDTEANVKIAVFGSSSAKEGSQAWKEAYEVGFLLAKGGYTVVNGGYGGTMLASARGAKEGLGKTIGVTTDEFPGLEKNEFIDQEIRKPTWRDRLFQLIALGDGFVILDGGTGTLAELAVVLEMGNKDLHAKPVVVLGKRMQSIVNFFKQNPEVSLPRGLHFPSTPKGAVQYILNFLTHA